MRVALVHDYLREFGGAERVLKVLTEMYPEAPIYTAFSVKGSEAQKAFSDKRIVESWLSPILKTWKLYSPLRFLTPFVWGSMDFSSFDLVITSASWYITRGFRVGPKTKVIVYCHTPPRWLYGYETSVGFTKYWPVKLYSKIVGYFMRIYDFRTAQKITNWMANSKNVATRIKKFYKKEATVIYPPVDVVAISQATKKTLQKDKYFLMVARLVGAKGLEEVALAFKSLNYKLKIVGGSSGYSEVGEKLKKLAGDNIELLGRLGDAELYDLYAGAQGLICLAKQEDFGMTPVEAMAVGVPVLAFRGGGYKESVIDGVTGVFITKVTTQDIVGGVEHLKRIKWDREAIKLHARKFSKERFIKEFTRFVASCRL